MSDVIRIAELERLIETAEPSTQYDPGGHTAAQICAWRIELERLRDQQNHQTQPRTHKSVFTVFEKYFPDESFIYRARTKTLFVDPRIVHACRLLMQEHGVLADIQPSTACNG